jgi:hypothetical protein
MWLEGVLNQSLTGRLYSVQIVIKERFCELLLDGLNHVTGFYELLRYCIEMAAP